MSVFEVCVDNIYSVQNAYAGGANRIELCSALSEGGLTPSLGFLQATRQASSPNFPIFPMIRPRGGNFIYDDAEIEIMESDIRTLKAGGANGFVFGLLTNENKIDGINCRRLLDAARPLPVTFHRAFDLIKKQEQIPSLEMVIELGFTRVLTSGGAVSAEEGLPVLKGLCAAGGGRVVVMPGAGVMPSNLAAILEGCDAMEFHGSAKGAPRPDGLIVTCQNTVRQMVEIANRHLAK